MYIEDEGLASLHRTVGGLLQQIGAQLDAATRGAIAASAGADDPAGGGEVAGAATAAAGFADYAFRVLNFDSHEPTRRTRGSVADSGGWLSKHTTGRGARRAQQAALSKHMANFDVETWLRRMADKARDSESAF